MIRAFLFFTLALPGLAFAEGPGPMIAELAREAFSLPLPDEVRIDVSFQGEPPEGVALVDGFRMNPVTGQFLAEAILSDGQAVRIAGLVSPLVPVPVPVRQIPVGTILSEPDIRMTEMHAARVSALAVLDQGEILGMQVRHPLGLGRPVMRQAISPPLVIRRGDQVVLNFHQGRLVLSAAGRALEDAHKGEAIRIVNLSSNKLVNAIASGPGTAHVGR